MEHVTVLGMFMAAPAPVAAVAAGGIARSTSTQAVFVYFGLGVALAALLFYLPFRELRSASY